MSDVNGIGAILVQLDTLLDTRIGVIAQHLSQERALAVLEHGYHSRMRDEFYGVEDKWFQEAYKNRDVETLKHSHPTAWLMDLYKITDSLREQAYSRPDYRGFEVIINSYPYVLSESVQKELCRCVAYHLKGTLDVRIDHLQPSELTPRAVKSQFIAMSMYDPYEWLGAHEKAFGSSICKDVKLFAPALYHQPIPSQETLQAKKITIEDPLIVVSTLAKFFVDLDLIPSRHFSLIDRRRTQKRAA